MLEELFAIHNTVVTNLKTQFRRYLYHKINWNAQAICIFGGRGVGKTTLMLQYMLEHYQDVQSCLYLSADNIHVLSNGLFTVAQEYFKFGGKAIVIDELHKYPNWAIEVKNIIDTYKDRQLILSSSFMLNLQQGKADLSRRVVYHELKGLSFREYLDLTLKLRLPVFTIEEIISQHLKIASQCNGVNILKHFYDYLLHGYYPFFLEGVDDYLSRVNNIVEKVIYEDIAVAFNLRQTTLPVLKKLLWLIATAKGLMPNIDRISRNLKVSREAIYNCFDYLSRAGLIENLLPNAKGMKLIRKPEKVFLDNTSLLHAINGQLKLESDAGVSREIFFVNQVSQANRINLPDCGDFIVNGKLIFEVGGKGKTFRQIKNQVDSYLALDRLEVGFGRKIPLYMFGFMY